MRRARPLTWLGAWVVTLACSGAPSSAEVERDAEPATVESDAVGPSTRADDPLLARARSQMQGGRVPDAVLEQLLASRDPDHRHAARLLQTIAGETPAAVLSRATGEAEPSAAPEPAPVELPPLPEPVAPGPVAEPIEPVAAPIEARTEEEDRSDDARLDPPPKWDAVPPDSPLRTWLAGAHEAEPPAAPVAIDLPLERLLGPELLLLRERPPRVPSGDGLIILTSMSLGPGDNADQLQLELAGSGPATVWVQPLDQSRLRLTIANGGAVPSFLAARPSSPGVTILDVARREHDVELELALAPGWRLVTVAPLGNGAAVEFSRSDTLSP